LTALTLRDISLASVKAAKRDDEIKRTTASIEKTAALRFIGSSIYHGMTASLTKRYSSGLQFQVNYTWSKTIDDTIDFSSFQNWFGPAV